LRFGEDKESMQRQQEDGMHDMKLLNTTREKCMKSKTIIHNEFEN
jgi:hypothetical protein